MRSGLFNNITTRVLSALLIGLLFIVIGGNIYRYINDRHDTKEAVLCTINEDIAFDGVMIRDEKVVTYNSGDIISYVYPDGSKVSSGDTVAKLFSSEENALASGRLEKTAEKLELLRKAQKFGNTDYIQPEAISRKIDDAYKLLVSCVNDRRYDDLGSQRNELLLYMNIYSVISNASADYNVKIAELEAEAARLREQSESAKAVITAPSTGYFVSYCDGYEDTLKKSMAMSLTKENIEQIISGAAERQKSVPDSYVGKMFDDYQSYIVGVIDSDPRVTEDSRLKLASDFTDTLYDVTVVSCKDAGGGKSVVVMSCDCVDASLASSRIHSMQIIFDEYSGIKVPRSAIRFQGAEKGVYVILGEDITFKKINVVYEGSDFVISENTSDDEYLRLYDQILLEVVSEEDVRAAEEKKKQLEGLPGSKDESDGDNSEDSGSKK